MTKTKDATTGKWMWMMDWCSDNDLSPANKKAWEDAKKAYSVFIAKVDLNTCKPGDKLLSKHGLTLEYVCKAPDNDYYDHEIRYPNGSMGTRTNEGFTYVNPNMRLERDHDIVEIVHGY